MLDLFQIETALSRASLCLFTIIKSLESYYDTLYGGSKSTVANVINNRHMIHKAIIICGSSRAGKTTLAKLACAYSNSHKGLIFEGLFPAYLSRLSYAFKRYNSKLFNEYLERPRFIDEKKSKTTTPAK